MKLLIVAFVFCFLALVAWTFTDPHADIPGISPVICSLKGGSWYDESAAWGVEAGCYERTAP